MPLLIPQQCRAARGLLDWTQEELAERADVSRSTIRDFENGRHSLHPGTAAQVVEALESGRSSSDPGRRSRAWGAAPEAAALGLGPLAKAEVRFPVILRKGRGLGHGMEREVRQDGCDR